LKIPKDPENLRAYPWVKASYEEAYNKVSSAFRGEKKKRKLAEERKARALASRQKKVSSAFQGEEKRTNGK